MEVGVEISQKIRSAIKAKLMELGSYVDNELPDYIMVMVANKKTKAQMAGDLSLFLGKNTEAFTTWLHGLLVKLQAINSDSDEVKGKNKKKKHEKSKKGESSAISKKKVKKAPQSKDHGESANVNKDSLREVGLNAAGNDDGDEKSQPEADVVDANNAGTEVGLQENVPGPDGDSSNSSDLTKDSANKFDDDTNAVDKTMDVEDVRQLLVTENTTEDALAEELETSEIADTDSVTEEQSASNDSTSVVQTKHVRHVQSESSPERQIDVTSRKRKGPVSIIGSIKISKSNEEEEDEYDPRNPSVGSVASVIKVSRPKSSIPQSLQANRDDETAPVSVGDGQDLQESQSTPVNCSNIVDLSHVREALKDVIQETFLRDEIALFSQYIDKELRGLSPVKLSLAKLHIQQLLHKLSSKENNDGSLRGKRFKEISENSTGSAFSMKKHFEKGHVENNEKGVIFANDMVNSESTSSPRISERSSMPCQSASTSTIMYKSDTSRPSSSRNMDNKSGDNSSSENVFSKEKGGSNSKSSKFDGSSKVESSVNVYQLKSSVKSNTSLSSNPKDIPASYSNVSSPTSTSGLDSLRKSPISTSESSMKRRLLNKLSHSPQAGVSPSRTASFTSFLVDSIHSHNNLNSESSQPVLKQNNDSDSQCRGSLLMESEESAAAVKPISSEALKVMAKNLKITVINKRAIKTPQESCSDSSSDESEDESCDDDSESDDEIDENDELKKKAI